MKPAVKANETRSVNWQLSFPGALFLLFLALKLGVGDTAVMDWSWWWVTAPLWLPAAFALLLGFVFVVIYGLSRFFE